MISAYVEKLTTLTPSAGLLVGGSFQQKGELPVWSGNPCHCSVNFSKWIWLPYALLVKQNLFLTP